LPFEEDSVIGDCRRTEWRQFSQAPLPPEVAQGAFEEIDWSRHGAKIKRVGDRISLEGGKIGPRICIHIVQLNSPDLCRRWLQPADGSPGMLQMSSTNLKQIGFWKVTEMSEIKPGSGKHIRQDILRLAG
jgi:hypothetical protein